MARKPVGSESRLYPRVERWLKKHHACFSTAVNMGLRQSRMDIIGIKDVGGDLSGEVETICVEVKDGREPFARACGQALGYSAYANRVYLADHRRSSFNRDEIAIASHLGVGLVRVGDGRCDEVLSSPYHKPIPKLNLLLLERLALGRCEMCSSFFATGTPRTKFSNLTRENLKQAILKRKGLMFWNYIVGRRKLKLRAPKHPKREETLERRFICPDCVDLIAVLRSQVRTLDARSNG